MSTTHTQLAAIYARYSTDNQRETSIEDQVRRCREIALKHNLHIPDELIFSDAAISGKDVAGRDGYQSMLASWESRAFRVLIVDSQSRLFRDEVECALLKKRIRETGVRVLTATGLDTATQGWELSWSFTGLIDAKYRDDTKHNVLRGMLGALERGYTVAQAPYGYSRKRVLTENGDHVGTIWEVHAAQSIVVRRIFDERFRGESYNAIASRLIADGVLAPAGGTWHPSSVLNVLTNRVYTGVISWNGSRITQWRARKAGQALDVKDFFRPELALIDPSLWQAVQPGSRALSKTGRSGGKHWCAGLIQCHCGTVLTVKYCQKPGTFSAYCSSCARNKRLGLGSNSFYVDTGIVRVLLRDALRNLITPGLQEEFKSRLRARLVGGFDAEIAACKERITSSDKALARLFKRLTLVDDDDASASLLDAEIVQHKNARRQAQLELSRLELTRSGAAVAALEAQLSVDLFTLVDRLFDESSPAALRAVLVRVFPKIVLEPRPAAHKREAVFILRFAPGVVASILTNTPIVDDVALEQRFRVLSSSRRAIEPTVERVAIH